MSKTIFLHPPTATPHDKIRSPEHNNLFLRYNLEAPERRNNSEANFGFSETKEKHTGRPCPAPGSQGGPRFVSPGSLLRSPEIWGNNTGGGEGKMGTESGLCSNDHDRRHGLCVDTCISGTPADAYHPPLPN